MTFAELEYDSKKRRTRREPGRPRRRPVRETKGVDCMSCLGVSGHVNTDGAVPFNAPGVRRAWAYGRPGRMLHERGSAAAAEARQGGHSPGRALTYSMRHSYRLFKASSLSEIGPINITSSSVEAAIRPARQ